MEKLTAYSSTGEARHMFINHSTFIALKGALTEFVTHTVGFFEGGGLASVELQANDVCSILNIFRRSCILVSRKTYSFNLLFWVYKVFFI